MQKHRLQSVSEGVGGLTKEKEGLTRENVMKSWKGGKTEANIVQCREEGGNFYNRNMQPTTTTGRRGGG